MTMESEKYKKVISILKESKPVLDSAQDIEREVIKKISVVHQPSKGLSDLVDFIFGWVYIGWVRRSLITASVVLVMVFVWQNSMILKQINYLSKQTMRGGLEAVSSQSDVIERGIKMYKLSGRRFPSGNITIPENQMKELLDSADSWKGKYKDLMRVINEDPELKKMIESKLIDKSHLKTKI